ncbi:hypothetical protein [Streptomyces antioxidans]|uniref:hypothetical protein n=1 Tax=Streptomyces antioxidans TaxID=1507734 RepID=UPI0009A461CF|nr:hypothetical protein [Streptomyces antioxidans]
MAGGAVGAPASELAAGATVQGKATPGLRHVPRPGGPDVRGARSAFPRVGVPTAISPPVQVFAAVTVGWSASGARGEADLGHRLARVARICAGVRLVIRRVGVPAAEREERMAAEGYPLAAAVSSDLFQDYGVRFEEGLRALVAGIEATLAPSAPSARGASGASR